MNEQKTFKQIIPEFIQSLEDKGRSPSTVLAYRSDLEQLSDFLAEKNISELSEVRSAHLSSFRDYLLAKKYTPKSVSRKLNAVKTFFRWSKSQKHVSNDPSKEVSHPKIESSTPKFLNQLEYRALRDVVRGDARIAAIVELILQTGLRISEIANLKQENFKKDHIVIEEYATQPERTVPMNTVAISSITEYMKERPESEVSNLFVSKNGKPLAVRNIRAAIDRYMQRADIPEYSVNDIRNTFIVENLKRGVDLVTVSQAAGHKRLSTTERYMELAGVKESGKKQKLEEL